MDKIASAFRDCRNDALEVHAALCDVLESLPAVDQDRLGAVLLAAVESEMGCAHLFDILSDLVDSKELLIEGRSDA